MDVFAVQHQLKRSALVGYGTETGNAQDIATEIGQILERHHFAATVIDCDEIDLVQQCLAKSSNAG